MMMVLEANASLTRLSAWATWQKSNRTPMARVTGPSPSMVSSLRIASNAEDSGSKMPSRMNIRQKSFRGVGDYTTIQLVQDLISHALLT